MSSGTALKEIQRFFEYLKQSKTNNEMTILITNDMCKDLQFMVENLCNYRDLLEDKIDKANEILSKSCFEYDNCPDNVINEIIELKEILGGTNENNNI